jgi:hypothetical protein
MITATSHPTGVAGTIDGIYQNTNTVDPSRDGFYRFNLALNMDNWAFAQGNAALNGNFFESFFTSDAVPTGPSEPPAPAQESPGVPIPAPGALPMTALMMLGLTALGRSKRSGA